MDYFSALGGFKPQQDADAAVKFALNALLLEGRLDDLAELLSYELGGVEGEPGWLLERRSIAEKGERLDNPPWPDGAMFRASVDPDIYRLAHPVCYMTHEEFMGYVNAGLAAFKKRAN
jgi:hypothetical protein